MSITYHLQKLSLYEGHDKKLLATSEVSRNYPTEMNIRNKTSITTFLKLTMFL